MEELTTTPKRKKGNPNWVKGVSGNPGGAVRTEAKPIRRILISLLEKPLSTNEEPEFTPRTIGEQVAWRYIENLRATTAGTKESFQALKEISDRIDGREKSDDEVADQMTRALGNVLLIGQKKDA